MSAILSVIFVVSTSAFIGASLVFKFHFYADATELAANVIKSATSLGCETIAAWLDATLRISAPMRLAMNSSACGGIIWSSGATMYHDGMAFQAGGPAFAVKESTLSGFCTAAMTLASVGSTSAANAFAKPSRSIHRKPGSLGGRTAATP